MPEVNSGMPGLSTPVVPATLPLEAEKQEDGLNLGVEANLGNRRPISKKSGVQAALLPLALSLASEGTPT